MIRKTLLTTISMLSAMVLASNSNADLYDHVDGLARDVKLKSQAVYREMVHYRHTPQYQCVRRDSLEMKKLANLVRRWVRSDRNIYDLECAVDDLDRVFHRVRRQVIQIERGLRRGVGYAGETCHVRELIDEVEACIDYLRADIKQLRRLESRRSRRAPCDETRCDTRLPAAPTYQPSWGYNRGYHGYVRDRYSAYDRARNLDSRHGLTFGNENFRFRIGF